MIFELRISASLESFLFLLDTDVVVPVMLSNGNLCCLADGTNSICSLFSATYDFLGAKSFTMILVKIPFDYLQNNNLLPRTF
jgi:hypothetical protein